MNLVFRAPPEPALARKEGLLEFCFLDGGEKRGFAGIAITGHDHDIGGLGHGLNGKDAWKDRMRGKMSLKKIPCWVKPQGGLDFF